MRSTLFYVLCFTLISYTALLAETCVDCHKKHQPNIVLDWELSKHSQNDVDCSTCHGESHSTDQDYKKAEIPTPETCAQCHDTQVDQFSVTIANHGTGDLNCDGNVELDDLGIVVDNWKAEAPGITDPRADANRDGIVELDDLGYVADNWKTVYWLP